MMYLGPPIRCEGGLKCPTKISQEPSRALRCGSTNRVLPVHTYHPPAAPRNPWRFCFLALFTMHTECGGKLLTSTSHYTHCLWNGCVTRRRGCKISRSIDRTTS